MCGVMRHTLLRWTSCSQSSCTDLLVFDKLEVAQVVSHMTSCLGYIKIILLKNVSLWITSLFQACNMIDSAVKS